MHVRPLLEQLERDRADPAVELAFLAAQWVDLDAAELRAARRRALLLLAAGGDPRRELDPGGRAVGSVAADLDSPERRAALAAALEGLRAEAARLPAVSGTLDRMLEDAELAWRSLACALLAEELAESD
jgi:hypothetical protein